MIKKISQKIKSIHATQVTYPVLNHDDFEHSSISNSLLNEQDMHMYTELVNRYRGEKRVLCHNDVSLSNLIYDEDSEEIHLIDYE